MYNYITDPTTNKIIKIDSYKGKLLLKQYIQSYDN